MYLFPDVSSLVLYNEGMHYHGIALYHPRSLFKDRDVRTHGLVAHMQLNHRHFTNQQISTILLQPWEQNRPQDEEPNDYGMKSLKYGKTSFDDIVIFPRLQSELSDKRFANCKDVDDPDLRIRRIRVGLVG